MRMPRSFLMSRLLMISENSSDGYLSVYQKNDQQISGIQRKSECRYCFIYHGNIHALILLKMVMIGSKDVSERKDLFLCKTAYRDL